MSQQDPYILQPGLQILDDNAVPKQCSDGFFAYPEPTNLNVNNREMYANTMIIGTAPFMALKGPPAAYIDVSDALRPQSTMGFNDYSTRPPFTFPDQYVGCAPLPPRVMKWNPIDTRAQIQNASFTKRYCKK